MKWLKFYLQSIRSSEFQTDGIFLFPWIFAGIILHIHNKRRESITQSFSSSYSPFLVQASHCTYVPGILNSELSHLPCPSPRPLFYHTACLCHSLQRIERVSLIYSTCPKFVPLSLFYSLCIRKTCQVLSEGLIMPQMICCFCYSWYHMSIFKFYIYLWKFLTDHPIL